MHSIDQTRRGRGTLRRSSLAPMLPLGLLLFLAIAALTVSRTVFPLFALLFVTLYFAARRSGRAAAWRPGLLAAGMPVDGLSASPPNGIDREKELLQALQRHGEITATRVALETSLSVSEAEEMLSGLASDGHVQIGAKEGRLAYAL